MRTRSIDGAARRFGRQPWLVILVATAAAAGAVTAVALLQQNVRASNAAAVRLLEAKADLNTLQWLPYEAGSTPAPSRLRMDALEHRIRSAAGALAAKPDAPDYTRLDGALEQNFSFLAEIYRWAVQDGKSIAALQPAAFAALNSLAAADAAFGELQRDYKQTARRAQTEALAGSAFAILLLLGGFSFFALRSARSRSLLLGQQRELARTFAELEEAQRAKDEFVSQVSHELRTPLTSIFGFTEILLEGEAEEERRRYLEIVERNGERLLHLVDDLLTTARIDAGSLALALEDVDLESVARRALEAAAPAAREKGVQLSLHAEPAHVAGDAMRLGQALDNLISNAIKFTPSDGHVVVVLGRRDDRAVLVVADTGIGIPHGEHERIFERFFRSSRAREAEVPGTGLGLAVTRGIVEAHGGTIAFESTDGQGTTFRIELPTERSPAVPLAA